MNLLDFQCEFQSRITFEGDNETDTNDLTIIRKSFDLDGTDIFCHEIYSMSRNALESMEIGLAAMLKTVRDYLNPY